MEAIIPIKITELGEKDFYFESMVENMDIYGTAETLTKALKLAESAVAFTLYDMFEDNLEFPSFDLVNYSNIEKQKSSNEFFTLIHTDLKTIVNKFGNEPVKKTISIPKYQEHYLNLKGISLSKYVQNNIEKDLQMNH